MKFRYYFLSFTLIMLTIYGLHVGYVYYFVENPYSDYLSELEYSLSSSSGSLYVAMLIFLVLFLNLPSWFSYFYLVNFSKQNDDLYSYWFGEIIRYFSLFIMIITAVSYIINSSYYNRSSKVFNEDYIDYMSKNLKTKEGIVKSLHNDEEIKSPNRWIPPVFVQINDESNLILLRCDIITFTPCSSSNKDKERKFSISYFKYEHTNKYGDKDHYYILFSMKGDKEKNINHYVKKYKSEYKTMYSVFFANIAILIVSFLFNLIIHFKVKKYVIN